MSRAIFLLTVVVACPPCLADLTMGFDLKEQGKSLVVDRLYAASMAPVSGVVIGDQLVSINGVTVKKQKDVDRLLAKRKSGEHVKLKFRRLNGSETISVLLMDADEVRKKSVEMAREKEDRAIAAMKEKNEERERNEKEALAADPGLKDRLSKLLDEWEFVKDSATDFDKAVHCDSIAECYLQFRDKEQYSQWMRLKRWYLIPPSRRIVMPH